MSLGPSDLVFNNNNGISSLGFDVKSVMMKNGISPIMTLNNTQTGGSLQKVSDLFGGLAIPAYAYHNNFQSGGKKYQVYNFENNDNDDDVIDDDLHDKLLNLMRENGNENKKKNTKKHFIQKKNIKKKIKNKIKK